MDSASRDQEMVRRCSAVLREATCPLNLVGTLGVGKSALVKSLPDAVVIDFDHTDAETSLRLALLERRGLVIADNADGQQRLKTIRAAFDASPGPAVVVTRIPVTTITGWSGTPTVTLQPLRDESIALVAAAAGVSETDTVAVVRLAAGLPLLAVAAARGLHRGIALRPDGPLADHVTGELLQRLGRELSGRRWLFLLRVLATMGAGDERLLQAGPGRFTVISDLSLIRRGTTGLAVAEPYRGLFETAYRWRDPGKHEATRLRASSYRLERVSLARGPTERMAQFEQAVFLNGDSEVRQTLFPPGRTLLPVRAATSSDSDDIGRLMRRWASRNGFDGARCDRFAEQWINDDVGGFRVIEDDDGIAGIIRLAVVSDRTVDGIEPLLQQHAGGLLAEGPSLFLGAAYCPQPVAHGQLLRYMIGQALHVGRLVVSTAGPRYQDLLGSLRFRPHGDIREDTFHCGKHPAVFSNQFTAPELPTWLSRLGGASGSDQVDAVAGALARLRATGTADSPLVRGRGAGDADRLRARLVTAIHLLVESAHPPDAEAGRILAAYYLGGRRTHLQVALHMHLSRATYFRRLRHGHEAVATLLRP